MAFLRSMRHTWRAAGRRGLAIIAVAAFMAIAAVSYQRRTPMREVLAPHGVDLESYVGAASCAECHHELSEQQSCSRMAATLQTAEEYGLKHPLPVPADMFDPDNHLRYRIDHRDGKLLLEVSRGQEVARAEMTYALGSGKYAVTFVRELDDDNYEELRASYYADTNAWDLTPGQKGARPASVVEALGRPISKRDHTACLSCHASLLVQSDGKVDPVRSRFGVDCERCHGPGREHVESVLNGPPTKMRSPALVEALGLAQRLRQGQSPETDQDELLKSLADVNDERLIRDLYVCGECHGQHEIWQRPKSDDDLSRFQVAALVASACYERSLGKIRCTDCHDPHGDLSRDDVSASVALCLQCHYDPATPPVGDAMPSLHGTAAARLRVPQQSKVCPENPRDGCIACHMPLRSPMRHTLFTHHRIGIYPRPDEQHASAAEARNRRSAADAR